MAQSMRRWQAIGTDCSKSVSCLMDFRGDRRCCFRDAQDARVSNGTILTQRQQAQPFSWSPRQECIRASSCGLLKYQRGPAISMQNGKQESFFSNKTLGCHWLLSASQAERPRSPQRPWPCQCKTLPHIQPNQHLGASPFQAQDGKFPFRCAERRTGLLSGFAYLRASTPHTCTSTAIFEISICEIPYLYILTHTHAHGSVYNMFLVVRIYIYIYK